MRPYSLAIYSNENLLLTELLEKIENEMPMLGFNLYGKTLAGTEIVTATGEYTVAPTEKLAEEDVLVVLSDPQTDIETLKAFDGDIIDFTGAFKDFDTDIYTVEDPVAYVLNRIVKDRDAVQAVATLPAALFGKSGIDDLLNQTRELFAFTNAETKVFEKRLSFNVFFAGNEKSVLAGYKEILKQTTGVDVDVRMIPVSTGFILDVYFKKDVNSNFTFSDVSGESLDTLSEVIEAGSIVKLSETGGRVSFAGDYIYTVIMQITDALKEITGED